MESNLKVRLFRTRKLIAWAILLVGLVAGMVVGYVVMGWVWPGPPVHGLMTMNEWRNQEWTLTIGFLTVLLVILPFAWIAAEPSTDDKKSDQPADADH